MLGLKAKYEKGAPLPGPLPILLSQNAERGRRSERLAKSYPRLFVDIAAIRWLSRPFVAIAAIRCYRGHSLLSRPFVAVAAIRCCRGHSLLSRAFVAIAGIRCCHGHSLPGSGRCQEAPQSSDQDAKIRTTGGVAATSPGGRRWEQGKKQLAQRTAKEYLIYKI